MCLRAGLLRTWAMIARSPIMCFDFGALKKIGRILNNPFSINLQGPQNRGSSGGPY